MIKCVAFDENASCKGLLKLLNLDFADLSFKQNSVMPQWLKFSAEGEVLDF